MTIKVRFAPSPTGFLHVGNIRAALINYIYAQKNNGKFYLRFDDTDIERSKEEYKEAIIEDLEWLGINYDKLYKQSDNLDRYEECKNKLIKSGRLYECYESQGELNIQRKSQIASGQKPIYDRASLRLTNEQKQKLKDSGIKPYYRFLLEDKKTSWDDKIKGKIIYYGRHFSDPVLIRENGMPTYTFCSVIDDIDHQITDIIRGEDHITNTAIQIQIFESLGSKIPNFAHLALVQAISGKISKRIGGFDIRSLRKQGFEAMTLINFLTQIGTSKALEIHKNTKEIINDFNFSKFSKSATKYDINELNIINHKLLQIIDFAHIKDRINNYDLNQNITKDFFDKIKSNLNFLHEIKIWIEICFTEFRYPNKIEDKDFLQLVAKLIPQDTKDINCWPTWLKDIKNHSKRQGQDLFMPIRLALSGQNKGPELTNLINLIEKEEIIKRLTNTDSHLKINNMTKYF